VVVVRGAGLDVAAERPKAEALLGWLAERQPKLSK
jgi:hypothetical protein